MILFLKIIALISLIIFMIGYGYYGVKPMWTKTKLDKQTSHKYDMISAICLVILIVMMSLIGIFA